MKLHEAIADVMADAKYAGLVLNRAQIIAVVRAKYPEISADSLSGYPAYMAGNKKQAEKNGNYPTVFSQSGERFTVLPAPFKPAWEVAGLPQPVRKVRGGGVVVSQADLLAQVVALVASKSGKPNGKANATA